MTKERVNQFLYSSEVRTLGIICNGLVHRTPKLVILKQIKKDLSVLQKRLGLSPQEFNTMWYQYMEIYNRVSKKTFSELRKIDKKFGKEEDYEKNLANRRDALYVAVQGIINNKELRAMKYLVSNDLEYHEKHEAIWGVNGIIETARDNSNYSPFFLCSTHINPAKDHEDWEGKIYYDEKWDKFITDRATKEQVEAYISDNDLYTLQYVVGSEGEVWLGTRRNCKHYFINVPIDKVLNVSVKGLLRAYKMYMKDEKKISPEQTRCRAAFEKYKALEYLNRIAPSDKLKEDLKKAKKTYIRLKQKVKD